MVRCSEGRIGRDIECFLKWDRTDYENKIVKLNEWSSSMVSLATSHWIKY